MSSGLSFWLKTAAEVAVTSMRFLNKRSQDKLNRDHSDAITAVNEWKRKRSPYWNDDQLALAEIKLKNFVTAFLKEADQESGLEN